MNAARSLINRNVAVRATTALQSRPLTASGQAAVGKLHCTLEEYRLANYTRELPSRFKKDIVKAATYGAQSSDQINREGLQRVLENIGAADRVSGADINAIFSEVGNTETGEISTKNFLALI